MLVVKKARSASARKAASPAKKVSARSVRRYLGHFGVGGDPTSSGSARKKTAGKKVAPAKKSRRVA